MDKIIGNVAIESGVMGLGDISLQPKEPINPDQLVQCIRDGKMICFGTGGDGTMGVIVRETQDTFDLLPDEGDLLAEMKNSLLLNVPSGSLIIADAVMMDNPEINGIFVKCSIAPGIYECKVNLCENPGKEFYGYVFILKKSTLAEAKNDVSSYEDLV